MTDDITSRLLAALDDTERDARAAIGHYRDGDTGTWQFGRFAESITDDLGAEVAVGAWGPIDEGVGRHIVRHDPQKVLRMCAALRDIVDQLAVTEQKLEVVNHRILREGQHDNRLQQQRAEYGIQFAALYRVVLSLAKGYDITPDDQRTEADQ